MMTFNLKAELSGNFYRGHRPEGGCCCWSDRQHALAFTLGAARRIVAAWPGRLDIVIAVDNRAVLTEDRLRRELFCIRGGNWYWWRHRERLAKMKQCAHEHEHGLCVLCGAKWHALSYWYDPMTGATIKEELVT